MLKLNSPDSTEGEAKLDLFNSDSDDENLHYPPTTQLALSGSPGKGTWKNLITSSPSSSSQASSSYNENTVPTPRWGHSATTVGPEKIIVFGGYGDEKFTNHLYTYMPSQKEWKKVNTKGHGPSPRSNHSATAVGKYLLIVHGGGKNGRFDTYHAYDSESERWLNARVRSKSARLPAQRSCHAACRIGGKYVAVFGGKVGKDDTSECFLLDVQRMLPQGQENLGEDLFGNLLGS